MQRVVVTGMGVISPVGCGAELFWERLVSGASGIAPFTAPRPGLNTRILAQVKDFDPLAEMSETQAHRMDRFAQFAVAAARAAVRDANLSLDANVSEKIVTVVGTGVGGQSTLDDAYWRIYGEGGTRVHPFTVPRLMVNAGASHITMDMKLKGPAWAVSTACASGTYAIGQAFNFLREGRACAALAGGSEACLTFGTIKGWEALRVLSNDTCRPFSKNRSGTVLGEGAAMFVLETLQAATARGARIYAEILGFGMSSDAGDLTAGDVQGQARAMKAAMDDAALDPGSVGYINAHGTGTDMNDRTEVQAIRQVFGPRARDIPVSSVKGALGHSLGGAGALEFAATVMALHQGVLPPTANCDAPDPDFDLDFVPNVGRAAAIEVALSNSFAFGGLNGVLAMGRVR